MTPALPPALANLQEKHRVALTQALQFAPGVLPVAGSVVAGSIVRGNPDPASDLDLVLLHQGEGRRRVQKVFNGVPVEMFFNPSGGLERLIQEESLRGRPVMAHMLATGVLLSDDSQGSMAALCRLARDTLRKGAALPEGTLLRLRYAAASRVEDALDFGAVDSPDALRLRAIAVEALLEYAFLQKNQFLPRPKERLKVFSMGEPRLAGGLALALSAPSAAVCQSALRNAAQQILGTVGFFEWDSGADCTAP